MDANGLYPIYAMWHVPFWQTKIFYMVVIFALVAVIFLILWYGLKKYWTSVRKRKASWDVALDDLADIDRELSQKGMLGKTFYFRLSWIFKRYLNERYGFEVYGKTDQEIVLYLELVGLAPDLVQDLRVIFEGSTAIKFANQEAVKERMNRDLATSIELIKRTVPIQDK